MTNKWERREKKYNNKNKMPMHGKGMKSVENSREAKAQVESREIKVGSTKFLCSGQQLIVHSEGRNGKYWGAVEVGSYPTAQFSADYIRKNML